MATMQFLPRISKKIRNQFGTGHVNRHSSTRVKPDELMSNLKRELYGMDIQEQLAVKQAITMAGQVVQIRQATVAINKNGRPCNLDKGRLVEMSEVPLAFDSQGHVQINVIDKVRKKQMFITLSDYIRNI